jgi:4-amino-4-deoxychorismate lyase
MTMRIRYQQRWYDSQAGLAFESRGALYGDGVFETLLYQPSVADFPLGQWHRARLLEAVERLAIVLDVTLLDAEWAEVLQACRSHTEPWVVKLMVTRGQGGRGYALPTSAAEMIWLLYPTSRGEIEPALELELADFRLGIQPALAGIKHLNRLEQVMAQKEAEQRGLRELLLCDVSGWVIESIRSNVFFWSPEQACWLTPSLDQAGVEGVARRVFLEKADLWGIEVKVARIQDWASMDEMFLINSVRGIQPVQRCTTTRFQVCKSQELAQLWHAEVLAWT